MTSKSFFVAGTDTGIGKTVVTGLLAGYLRDKGFSVITQKWVQTGSGESAGDISCHLDSMGADRNFFKKYSDLAVPYSLAFPASPHLASAMEKVKISTSRIRESFLSLTKKFDVTIVEGTGGLLVPLNERELAVDVVGSLPLNVILVVGNRLGAINHALLSAEALKNRGIAAAGIIFNRFCPAGDEIVLRDNRKVISLFSGLEDLGEVPYETDLKKRSAVFGAIGQRVMSMFSFPGVCVFPGEK